MWIVPKSNRGRISGRFESSSLSILPPRHLCHWHSRSWRNFHLPSLQQKFPFPPRHGSTRTHPQCGALISMRTLLQTIRNKRKAKNTSTRSQFGVNLCHMWCLISVLCQLLVSHTTRSVCFHFIFFCFLYYYYLLFLLLLVSFVSKIFSSNF